jgi:hypothetical protein
MDGGGGIRRGRGGREREREREKNCKKLLEDRPMKNP